MKTIAAVALALALGGAASAVAAADFEVLMLNKGTDGKTMGFSPSFLRVEPGDTVTFIPVDKGHNAETILGMIPDNAETWKGKVDEQLTVTLTEPGLYGFKCFPHFAMGMVGLVQVGDDQSNLKQLMEVRLPGKAQARMMELFAKTSPRS
ncbi:MAG: pseudoazurin [Devosia sp.]|uniref:pseudoazurin n=1 Tax=Devosia sp. 66-22 TaxID=1895753 RepID=UPI00092AE712|nr:pseudoazurin [Devosia sp. 66-22]MBN9348617.1 pseudoazurin [Devosia sp.]OJX48798.1 MAG: pseudoazurin [Devosia sp. 66-22]